jgi:hypothetical protein
MGPVRILPKTGQQGQPTILSLDGQPRLTADRRLDVAERGLGVSTPERGRPTWLAAGRARKPACIASVAVVP